MDFCAQMRSKCDLKSRNFGDISRPLARGGQMGLQGLQNDAKMVPKGGQEGPKWTPWTPQSRPKTPQTRPKTPQRRPKTLQRRPRYPQDARGIGNPSEY